MQASQVVQYDEVEAVPVSTTVAMVNNFVLNTSSFLNRCAFLPLQLSNFQSFSYLCEEKLMDVSRHIQQLEITLALFEAKLASIGDIQVFQIIFS
jgi:hypothetical protein